MASNDPASPPPRSLPQPVETSQKARRRLVPEPVEQTARSNRKGEDGPADTGETGSTVRKSLPQPVETSTKTSKTSVPSGQPHNSRVTSPHRVLAQPIESSKTSSKTRKFAPQLMETARRSRKRTDTLPAILPSDKTDDYQPHELLHIPKHLRPSPIPPVNSPVASPEQVPQLHESHFSFANLAKRAPCRHSFRVPELARIASSESEEELESPPLSTSPSAKADNSEHYRHATRIRESVDDRSSGYLLALAAKVAQKQLREQVLAAYPNEHDHEPVDHFAVDRDSDTEEGERQPDGHANRTAMLHKRDSDEEWDAAELREHRDKLRSPEKDHKDTVRIEWDRRKLGKGPFADAGETAMYANAAQGGEKGADKQEWRAMRKAASPPMAGGDLRFPKCQSPRQTRLDVGSYPLSSKYSKPRSPTTEHSGLWTPSGGASRQGSKSGLWMGVCALSAQEALAPPPMSQSGLLTPGEERDDPFTPALESKQQLPPSPPGSFENKTGGIDDVLQREKTIDEEFDDAFVTQIYNYLSLGYPSLAQKFDCELSKITKVPVATLRRDDCNANAKGYVGAPEGTGSDMRGMQEGHCERWIALRLYVREWARQHPHMLTRDDGPNKDWGARARKGSWAF